MLKFHKTFYQILTFVPILPDYIIFKANQFGSEQLIIEGKMRIICEDISFVITILPL